MAQVRRQPMRIRPQVEELEPRVLYSADLPLGLGPVAGNAETRLIDSAPSTAQLADSQVARRELVVIDAGIVDADALLASLGLDARRADILRLGAGTDGIAELGAALRAYDGLQTLHILAHGDAGLLRLGASRLDGLEMVARADEVAAWGAALDADADILVYGCDVAQGDAGAAWVHTLASLTGADVAASDDATGAAGLGGDWRLEYRAGAIDDNAVLAAVEPSGWQGLLYANGYTYRREISVPTVDGTHLDFPMLVSGTYASLATTGNGGHVENANGYDIIFTADAAGTSILDHEIEVYDPTTGQVALWVRVPTLASGATIYMFYGNAAVTSSQEDISGTWDASYRGVWHLNEAGTGAAGEYQDSSANANHGDGGGATPNSAPAQVAGQIGAAQDFTASESDFISVADDASLNITGSLTLEAWVNGDSWMSASGNNVVVARQFGTDILDAYNLLVNDSPTSTSQPSSFVYGYEVTGGSLSTNTWYHVAATYTSNSAVLYVNGVAIVTQAGTVTFANDANPLLIGANENTPTNIPSSFFDGVIDEARLSASARSAQWLATGYANQNNPAAFYVLGAETSSQAPTATNLNAPETYVEDTPLNLTDIVVADTDSANLTVALTLSNAAAGALNTATAGSTTSTYAAGVWSASGPIADLNTLLAGLTFTPALNYNASFSIATSVSDGANTLTGGKAMTGTPAADPPDITSNGGGATAATSIGENTTAVTTVQAIDPDVPAQPIAYSISGGADAALFQIDAASGALSFVTAPDFEIPGDQDTNNVYEVTVRASDSGTGFDEQTLSVQVTNVNDAPVISLPASRTVLSGQSLVFSSTTGTALSVADVDINTGSLSMTLAVAHGTLTLGQTTGLTFSTGDGSGDATMSFNGTLAAVNAALNGLIYAPTLGYVGTDSLSVTANDNGNSGGAPLTDNDAVAINVLSPNAAALWLTGNNDVTVGTGVVFDTGEVMSFGDPNFALEPGTTSGTFASAIDFRDFTSNNSADLSGIHRVTRTVTVGSGSSTFTLQRGDVLFSVENTNTFGGVSVTDRDLAVFRPASPNNYTSGTFSILLSAPSSDKLREFALVEQTVSVGGVSLNPGDLLLVHSGGANDKVVTRYVATGVGASTAGAFTVLVDGTDIGFAEQIGGLHLIQETTVLGDVSLNAGQLLMSVRNNDTVGTNNLAVTKYDVFVLSVTQAGNNTVATATLLLQGGEVGLSASGEEIYGLAVAIPNYAPVLSGANNLSALAEDPALVAGTQVADLIVGHIDDPDIADARGIAVTGLSGDGTWQYSTNGGGIWNNFGAVSTSSARLLGSANQVRFLPTANWNGTATITSQAWDQTAGSIGGTLATTPNGGYTAFSAASATSNQVVTPVNDAPVITSNGGGATAALDRAENTASVTTVTASDVDLPTQTLTYSLTGGADMARFQIGASSGVLSFVPPLPDYELPGDANQDNIYEVTVQVADGNGGVDSQSLTVTLQDIDDTTTLYLDGDTTPPFSAFSTAVPTGTTLDNFDPARDSQPGLLLAKGGDNLGANQTDDSRHHTWVLSGPVNILSDPVRLLLWSDMKDGMNAAQTTDVAQGKAGSVTAYLLDLASATAETGGTVIASTTVSDSSWGDGYAWEQKTFDFGTVTHNVAAGHFLAVKIVVNDASGDDLWFAYDTSALASRLVIGGTNQAPVITSNGGGATATQNVNENATLATTVTATDADTPTLSFGIVGGTDAARFSIHPTTGVLNFVSPPDYEFPNDANADRTYNVIVQVSDGAGGTDSQTLDVAVQPVNESAPVITSNGGGASATVTVNENTSAVTTVTATDTDLPAPTLTYSVSGTDAARFSINPTTGVLNFASAPDYEAPTDNGGNNVYNIVVQVSDGTLTDTQTLTVTVAPLNDNSPIIGSNGGGATATVSVNENTTAVTTVTATDADRPIQTLTYSIVTGSDSARFNIGASTGVLSFITAPDHENPTDSDFNNSYVVRVRADDGNGNSDEQVITVTLVDVSEPFDAVDDSASADEDASVIIPVLTNDLHPDDTLSVLGATPPAHGSVTINGDGTLTYAPSANYFGPDSFQYVIRGSDTPTGQSHYWTLDGNGLDAVGGAHATTLYQAATIAGRDGLALDFDGVNDYVALPDISYNNEFSVSFWFRMADNNGSSYRYIYSQGTDVGVQNSLNVYTVEASTSVANPNVLRTRFLDTNDTDSAEGLDVSMVGLANNQWHQYTLTVSATGGATVYVDGVQGNHRPGVGGGTFNPGTSLHLGARADLDSTRFYDGSLDSVQVFGRALTLAEVTTLYNDGLATATVSVTVNPVNDAPTITSNGGGASAAVSIAENTTAVATITASDVDTPTASLTYSLVSGGDSGRFQINANTGVLSFLAAPDYEAPSDANADNVYNVNVQVDDGAGGSDTQAITVTVTPTNDNAPTITSNGGGASATVSVPESTTAVTTVIATDADLPAQSLTYYIDLFDGGADMLRFNINPSTGVLRFYSSRDYENPADANDDNIYEVVVKVTDGTHTDRQAISVAITPVNESTPVITSNGGGASATINIAENTTAVTTVTSTDADLPAQARTYSIQGGADAARFQIDGGTGVLTFLAAPDYEAPTDAGANNGYIVVVGASDGEFMDTQTLTVNVTPVNDEDPTITSNGGGATASVNVAEGTTAVTTVTATDADLPTQTLSYSLAGGTDAGRFTIGSSTGVLTFLTAPNYEAPNDANTDNVYVVIVQSSDATRSDTQTISVTVTPVNENTPVITSNGGGATAAVSVAENTTAVTTVTASDDDLPAQTLTYSLNGGADAARFQIDSITGALSFLVAPDRDAPPTDANNDYVYEVIVLASDGILADTQAISVAVTAVNEHTPDITSNGGGATASLSFEENISAVTTVVASDADLPGDTRVYSLAGGADDSLFRLDASLGTLDFLVAPDFEAPQDGNTDNVYEVIVRVSDGMHSVTQAISITITNGNDNGVGGITDFDSATPNQIAENTDGYVGLTARAVDNDGDAVSYTLVENAGGRFEIDPDDGRVSVANAALLDYEIATAHAIKVRATSEDGSYSESNFTINILPVNDNSPVITSDGGNAPATLYVAENTSAVTTVTATDADLPTPALFYGIAGGSDASRFQIDEISGVLSFVAAPDFEIPVDFNNDNVYQVIVEASDGTQTGSQTLSITVTPRNDNTPAITSDGGGNTATATIQENDNANVYVTTVTATDADLPVQAMRYEIAGGVDSGFFQIDQSTGILGFIHPNYDALADADRDNVYEVIVRASDGVLNDLQTINVTVTPRNDNNPEITSNGGGDSASIGLPENEVAVTTVTAKDSDLPPQTLTYSIAGGADAARFQIVAATGVLSFLAGPDYDIPGDANLDNVYEVTVQVSDGNGGTDTQALSVSVTPLSDNTRRITSNGGGATATIGVPEDQTAVTTVTATDADVPAQTLSFAIVGGADAALFAIDAHSGVLRFLSGHDYEAPVDADLDNTYVVVVEVDDGNGGRDSQTINVAITPVNDHTPVITSNGGGATATVDVPENTVAVTDVDATDADRPPQELVYSIVGGADAAGFSINPGNGVLEFLSPPNYEAPTDVGGDNVYVVIVQVDDLAGGTDTQEIKVRVTPVNEFPPVITSDGGGDSATLSFSENTPISTPITQVTATDADRPVVPLTYSLIGGADRALFQIDAANGNLFFVTAPVYQPGGNNQYVVTVQVLGEAGNTDTQTITVEVTEFNLAPVLNGGDSLSVTVDENSTAVAQITATDAEDDANQRPLTYSIQGGADANRFTIDAQSGRLSFVQAPDYEAPNDQGADNVYDVTVAVRDSRGATDRQSLRVAVAPLNESPETTGIADQRAQEGEPFSLAVAGAFSDPDAGDRLTYSVSGLPAWLRFDAASATFSGTPGVEDATETPLNIVVTATDSLGLTVSAGFALSVGDINIAPVGVADSYQGDEDTRIEGYVLGNDRDLDKDALSATLLSGPSHGRLSFNADGSFVYTPDADFNGNDGFIYQAGDGELASAPISVSLLVLPVNDAPIITANGLSVTGGGSITLSPANLAAADVDGGGNLTFVVVAVSGGQFEFAERPGQPVSSFSQADIAAGKVLFVSTDSAQRPAFTLQAGDGQMVSTPSQGGVDFTPMILVDNPTPPPSVVAPTIQKPSDKPDERKERLEETASDTSGEALVEAALRLVQQFNEASETGAGRLVAAPQTLATAVAAAFGQALVNLAGFQANPVAAAPFQLAETQMALLESMQIEALDALKNSFGNDTYNKALDQMRQTLEREATLQHVVIGSSVALSGGLSIGYVLWLLRGGALLGSLLSAMPAWTLLDPVPVLAYYMKQDKGAASDKTERMFEKATAAKGKTIWARIKGMRR